MSSFVLVSTDDSTAVADNLAEILGLGFSLRGKKEHFIEQLVCKTDWELEIGRRRDRILIFLASKRGVPVRKVDWRSMSWNLLAKSMFGWLENMFWSKL